MGLILFIIRENAFNFNIDWNFIKQNNPKEMIRFALVFALAPVASYGIKFVDGIIMGKYLNLAMVGVYSIAVFIPTFIEAPMTALEKIANPKIADALHRNDVENIKDIYYKSCRYMMGLGGFLVLMIFINTQYLFTFLPEIYSKGIYVIYIVSFSALMNLYTGTNNTLVFNSSNYIFGTMLLFTIMLCTIGLSIVLIPIWGLEGAAIANASAGMIYNVAKFVFIKNKYKLQPYDFRNLKIVLITGVCLSAVWFLPEWKNIYLSGIYKSALLGSIYLGSIYISKSITIKEILKG